MKERKRTYQKHKEGYKISINYFLDKHIKAAIDSVSGIELFPLYITVRVKRQSTTVKSRINIKLPLESLPDFLESPYFERYIYNEKNIIEQTIILLKPNEDINFKIQDWYRIYERGLVDPYDCINKIVLFDIKSFLRTKKEETLFFHIIVDDNSSEYERILKDRFFRYKSELEETHFFQVYQRLDYLLFNCELLKSQAYLHSRVPSDKFSFTYKFCVWDMLSNFFQSEVSFVDGNGAESVKSSFRGFSPFLPLFQHYLGIGVL